MKRPKSIFDFIFFTFAACLIISCELTGSGQFTTTDPWLPTITFNGQESVIQLGGSMTITASVTPAPDKLCVVPRWQPYSWSHNGYCDTRIRC
jgi:hypothetical protein